MRLREEIEEALYHPKNEYPNPDNSEVEKNLRILGEILLDIRDELIIENRFRFPKD